MQQNTPAPPANAGEEPIIFNPVSKWQEYVEVPGLTLFDIHREPRRVNEDPTARARLHLKVRTHLIWSLIALENRRSGRIDGSFRAFIYSLVHVC